MSYEFWYNTLDTEGERIVDAGYYDYDWSIVQVYRRHSNGKLYMYQGSGCSCNSPSEDVGSWDDMVLVTSVDQVVAAIDELYSEKPTPTEVVKIMAIVAKALRRRK